MISRSLTSISCKLQKQTSMIVDTPMSPSCAHARMDEHPICSPASVAPSNAKEREKKKHKRSRSQAREVTAARHAQASGFQEREWKSPTWEGEGGTLHGGFLGLDTGLRNPLSVLLPPSLALDVCSSRLHFLSQLPLASLPDPPLLCPGPAEGHCR